MGTILFKLLLKAYRYFFEHLHKQLAVAVVCVEDKLLSQLVLVRLLLDRLKVLWNFEHLWLFFWCFLVFLLLLGDLLTFPLLSRDSTLREPSRAFNFYQTDECFQSTFFFW